MASKRAFRIGRSRTGLGLLATTPIKKGAFIVEYKGRKLTTEQANKLEARGNRYLCEINSRWTIDGTSRKNLGRYVNHSCRPNAEAHTIGHKVIIRAIKNIRAGAEITYNYGRDYLINVITRRGCKCDKCRKRRADVRANARAKSRRAPRSRRKKGKKKEMRVTTAGKNRIAIYGPKTVLFGALLMLSGCTREEATASLRAELQVDEFEIIHARFPCRSPDMHFFGYRFRIGLKGEYAFGDICWNASAQKWTWQILPDYPLSRLNIHK